MVNKRNLIKKYWTTESDEWPLLKISSTDDKGNQVKKIIELFFVNDIKVLIEIDSGVCCSIINKYFSDKINLTI